MRENIKFSYLYRDSYNYKVWNDIIFSNPLHMSVEEVDTRLKNRFETEYLFIADQIRVPELFPYLYDTVRESDHCYHEFDSVELTTEQPTDVYGRTIQMFVEEVENTICSGWQVFDPRDRGR